MADEVSTGKSSVDTEPSGWLLTGMEAEPTIIPPGLPPPPIFSGGTKRLSASLPGMGWDAGIDAAALTEPVVVLSKPSPPSELHPESAVALAKKATIAAVLNALPVTRLLISPLYAGTQWTGG
ncbi:hypothetical protein [Devosia sp. CN2-171]|uniref:hypothetical protein n=1 Tax=Devosia sp. CN2-171 TaxID=3400909 RepID=UPI003BF79177